MERREPGDGGVIMKMADSITHTGSGIRLCCWQCVPWKCYSRRANFPYPVFHHPSGSGGGEHRVPKEEHNEVEKERNKNVMIQGLPA